MNPKVTRRPRQKTLVVIALAATLFTGAVFLHQRMQPSRAVSATLVINEIDYDQPSTDTAEFLELKNVSASTINLDNYTVELVNGASGGAAIYQTIDLPNVNLVAGDYYVICANALTVANCDLDVNPNTNLIQNGNPDGVGIRLSGVLQDAVSYGGNTGAPYTEGSGSGLEDNPATANMGISRCADGVDTDVNNVDLSFRSITPGAANSCTVADVAPSVSSTNPAAGATNVPPANNISVTFSEPVNVTGNWFQIVCSTSGTRNVSDTVVTGGPTTYSINPNADFAFSESCTVTVFAAQVTDQDTNDPPDQMAANFAFSFTTASPVDTAPAVASTTPANGATNIAVNSNVVINFSESVTASASAFSIHCPTGVPQAFSQTASPATSFTLDPTADLPYSTLCTVTVTANQITDTDVNDPPDNMAADVSFSFSTAAAPPPVIINEIDSDTPGADAAEFIELYDGGVGNFPLTGLVVVLYNGSSDQSYAAFDLDGYTTDANGYFTLGNVGTGATLTFAGNTLQNGADAVALYVGDASSFPPNTPVTTANLVDAIVYDTGDPDDAGLLVLLNAGQPQVNEGSGGTSSVGRCPNGSGGRRNTSTYYQGAPSLGLANNCPPPQPPSTSPILISQVYGGGGNSGATYQNDYVELYNRSLSPVDTAGWSIQYTSEDGDSWEFGTQPLGGTIGPGEYYLIALGSGGAVGAPLPPAQINGQINMSGTSGKVALVNSFDGLVGNCPLGDPSLMDFVGYGSPDCREGPTPAPAPSNTTAIFRIGGGSIDTNNNGNDFVTGAPNPRQTATIVELGPLVLRTDPRKNGTNAPRDASINVTFTEPVNVVGSWYDITCPSGQHNDATFAITDGNRTHVITPNVNFVAGEQCTVTIFKDQIHDVDSDDSAANTDGLPANYVWTFTVATGTAPPYLSSVHLTMGDPGCGTIYGCAAASLGQPSNFLMDKPEFTISYNRDRGGPNWVSWHLSDEWVGSLTRVDTFRPDPGVPDTWYRVQAFDFSGSGFDRGHMTPNADRDKETSIPINQATFLMSNMVAQAPDNNQGPWAALENYLRTLLPANEIYIVSGGFGTGGTGSAGPATTIASGHVNVPASTWKVALVLPKASGDDISRVDCSTRSIAVIMPNVQGIRNNPWENYLTTVDAVEALTGYDFFQNLPDPYERCVEAGTNGVNPPLDTDADGDPDTTDCAPFDAARHHGAVEVCNGLDDDCDGLIDEGVTTTFYQDADGDGFGNPAVTTQACAAPAGYVADNTDCNDADATVHSPQTYYADADHDGFGDPHNPTTVCSSTPPAGYVTNSSDCDDTRLLYTDGDNDGFGAGAPTACGVADNTDCNDADASVHSPQTYYADADHDGFGDPHSSTTVCSSTAPTGYVANNSDCDDTKLLYTDADGDGYGTGAPVACGVADNTDCNDGDATVHSPQTYYRDADGDGFGNPADTTSVCSSTPPSGYVANNTDCNDADASVHAPQTYYRDADGDGFGNPADTTSVCSSTPPSGYVTNNTDCDDTRVLYADGDNDGFGAGAPTACGVANNTDCNDADATVHAPQTYYRDADGDGFGNPADTTSVCSSTPPSGYVTNSSDCDDTRLLYADADHDGYGAGSPVACGVANNTDCNDADASVHSPQTYYRDADGDGFGNPNNSTSVCSSTPPSGYVTNSTDCDDTRLLYADTDGDGYGSGSPVPCGVANNTDNCPTTFNPDQRDTNGDGVGDACTPFEFPAGGMFVIGDNVSLANGATVYFWGSQWSQNNPMSGGSAPNSFKGFEDGTSQSTCGGTWTSSPGNSSNPPSTIPQFMAVIVSSSVQKNGSTISGNIQKVIIVRTNPGYGPSPGHAGTGQVVAILCAPNLSASLLDPFNSHEALASLAGFQWLGDSAGGNERSVSLK